MSKFTTEVRFICETAAGLDSSVGFNRLEEILTAAAPRVFDFDFPIFDENYRLVLEKKILRHYYTREIGEETVGLWKLRLNARLNEIMPFYNKLYQSELLEFNPFYDTDYTRTGKREGTGTDNITGANTKTGTIKDDGYSSGSDIMAGTVGDVGSTEGTESMTGTVGDVGHTSGTKTDLRSTDSRDTTDGSKEVTGTVSDNSVKTSEHAKSGSDVTSMRGTKKDKNELHTTRTDGGQDTVTENDDAKNDHWDYYSDTPQGTIGYVPGAGGDALAAQAYLTNVRHITDDTSGSEKETTTDYGKTVSDTGYTELTTTHNTDETVTFGGVENGLGTEDNTRTYDTLDKTDETKTSVKTDTGESAESGQSDKTTTYDTLNAKGQQTSATRTYDTTNTKDVEDSSTRTFDTVDSSQTEKLSTNLDEYSERVFGKRNTISYAKLLTEFRETFLNIDMLIINQLSDLFMGLWD